METEIKIPKSFKLYTHKIKIVIDNKLMNEKNNYGEAVLRRDLLRISTKDNRKKRKKDRILETFYHEKVHHILYEMEERELGNNEKFVNTFANLLLQSDLTAKY
jgi:hypothetical protein